MKLNPWIHYTLVGFATFNVVLGTTLFFYYPPIALTVVSPSIPQPLWASIFLASGLLMFYGLYARLPRLLRYMMIFGLFMKTMWEIGLLFRLGNGGGVIAVELWGMIAYMQLLGVVYFNPGVHYDRT